MSSASDPCGFRVGVVGVPGGWSTEALADAFENRTGFRLVVDMERVALDLEEGVVRLGERNLFDLDGLVVKKVGSSYGPELLDRLELLRFTHEGGTPVFSSPRSMLAMLDRMSCTLTLGIGGIPLPPTVITGDVASAVAAVRRFERAVLKPLYSTKARGMRLVEAADAEEEVRLFRAEGNPMIYVQRLLPGIEKDLGLAFLGGEYLGAYARVRGKDAWNTTISAGGRYAPVEPSSATLDVARRAQGLFDLEFTTVDVVETHDGPLVFEVSAFGGFRGIQQGLGMDAAALYADHVLRRIVALRRQS